MHGHRLVSRLGVVAAVHCVFACNSMLGVDDVGPQPPDATGPMQQSPDGGLSQPGPPDAPAPPPPDAPPPPTTANCRIAPRFPLIMSSPTTSALVHRSRDGGTSMIFILNNDTRPDVFGVQLFNGRGGHGTLDTIGMFPITPMDADAATCGLCVLGFTDIDLNASTIQASYLALSQGSMTITRADGRGLTGHMDNLRLRHVDFSSGAQRELNDGCFLDIELVVFDMEYEPAVASSLTEATQRTLARSAPR